jgi:hypothetical protein
MTMSSDKQWEQRTLDLNHLKVHALLCPCCNRVANFVFENEEVVAQLRVTGDDLDRLTSFMAELAVDGLVTHDEH